MLLLVLRFLEKELGRTRMSACRGSTTDLGELFRLDAKAEGEDDSSEEEEGLGGLFGDYDSDDE